MTDSSSFRTAAERIYEDVLDHASSLDGGKIGWPIYRDDPQTGRLVVDSRADLYKGQLGIALLPAGLYAETGDDRYRRDVSDIVGAMLPIRTDDFPRNHRVGIGEGVGAWIYGLTKLSQLVGDDEYLSEASRIVSDLSLDRIQRDEMNDLIYGKAGLALALLAYYEYSDDERALELAIECGTELLDARIETDSGESAWTSIEDWPLTGFAHGSAGIAYALARLADHAKDPAFTEIARSTITWENQHFDSSSVNWSDLRGYTSQYMDGWCYGRTGIGIARLNSLEYLDSSVLHRDVNRILDGFESEVHDEDSVCHGSFGRVAFLLQASQRLSRPELKADAVSIANTARRRRSEQGHYALPNNQYPGLYRPTFFLGTAGIAYLLLRLRTPDLPAITAWE